MVDAGGWFQSTGGVGSLWVIAARIITVRSAFCQHIGPADVVFSSTGAAAYH